MDNEVMQIQLDNNGIKYFKKDGTPFLPEEIDDEVLIAILKQKGYRIYKEY
jgi:hypothetical protein